MVSLIERDVALSTDPITEDVYAHKCLEMDFYRRLFVCIPKLKNPTLIHFD
jgi:hypothetical protein